MKKQRAFLKWAGGKYGLVEDIQRHLPPAKRLIEPFVGAGSVFLNTDYEEYLLADINKDLIISLVTSDVKFFPPGMQNLYILSARINFISENLPPFWYNSGRI